MLSLFNTVNFFQKTVFQVNTVKYNELQSNTKTKKNRKTEKTWVNECLPFPLRSHI